MIICAVRQPFTWPIENVSPTIAGSGATESAVSEKKTSNMSLMQQQPPPGTSKYGRLIGTLPRLCSRGYGQQRHGSVSRRAIKLDADCGQLHESGMLIIYNTVRWPTTTLVWVDFESVPEQPFPQRTQFTCATGPLKRLVIRKTSFTESLSRQF